MILAHLTDLHLNGSADRRTRVVAALRQARGLGAAHLLLTGDLTAYGTHAQVAELSRLLADEWPAAEGLGKTVVPGNHDGDGPIDKHFPVGEPTEIADGAVLVPVDTRFKRRALAFRALGAIGKEALGTLERVSRDPARTVVAAMHHGPHGRAMGFFEGTVGRQGLGALMKDRPHLHVCCGHDHRSFDRGNVHVANAVAHHQKALRLYEVGSAGFRVL
jgi:3',5'-cyclic AMP phosphodiesterase CpdA